jgi:hypothetical protein
MLSIRHLILMLSAAVVLVLGGCAAPTVNDTADPGPDREASASFTKFFHDAVNEHSGSRWSTTNTSGQKAWVLSNTSFSAPKAWVIGQNYWNNENDTLMTNNFPIPANTPGVKLSFYYRFSMGNGDFCQLQYSVGAGPWQNLGTWAGPNTNEAWPNWEKATYSINTDLANPQDYRVRWVFNSDGSGTGWGFGVDSVSVYQRQLAVPTGVQASNGGGGVVVSWNASTDVLDPDAYEIWVADTFNGTYQFVISVPNPDTDTDENASFGAEFPETWWYKVKAVKDGYPDSEFSAPDEGWWVL